MNKLFNNKMYFLSLGESLKKGKQSLTRVPGGWLYKIEKTEEDIYIMIQLLDMVMFQLCLFHLIMNFKMINKYLKQLEDLLQIDLKIFIWLDKQYVELTNNNLTYIKNNPNGLEFKIVDIKSKIISTFKLIQMTGCCGICVSTKVFVAKNYRNKGVNTILNNFRIDIAKELGYGLLLCTDVSHNVAEVKTLDKNG